MYNIDNNYDLPRDVLSKDTLCQLIGRNEIVLENYRCVKSINDKEIEVLCKKYRIIIKGECLYIKYYNNESMVVGGTVYEVSFC